MDLKNGDQNFTFTIAELDIHQAINEDDLTVSCPAAPFVDSQVTRSLDSLNAVSTISFNEGISELVCFGSDDDIGTHYASFPRKWENAKQNGKCVVL